MRKSSSASLYFTFSLAKTSDSAENLKFHTVSFFPKAKRSKSDAATGSTHATMAPAPGNGFKIFPEILGPNQITHFKRSPPRIIILTDYLRFDLENIFSDFFEQKNDSI